MNKRRKRETKKSEQHGQFFSSHGESCFEFK